MTPKVQLPNPVSTMRNAVLLLAATALAACGSTTSSGPSTGAGPTTTSVSTGNNANVEFTLHPDNRPSSSTVQAPPERVWAVLPTVYEGLNIPVGTIDPNARLIGNRRVQVRSGRVATGRATTYLNCGNTGLGAPIADSYEVHMSVLTQLVPSDGGTTQVQTSVEGNATQRGVSGAPVRCASSGRLEEQIAAAIRQQLQSR
jgi:hypothetical protein